MENAAGRPHDYGYYPPSWPAYHGAGMTPAGRPHDYGYYPPSWPAYHGAGMTLRHAILAHYFDGVTGRLWEGQDSLPAEVMDGIVLSTIPTSVGTCYLLVRSTSGTLHICYGPSDINVPTRESQGRLRLGFIE